MAPVDIPMFLKIRVFVFQEVLVHDGVNIGVAETKGLVLGREDDDADLSTAQHTELTGFFEQTLAALRKGDLEIAFLLKLLDFDLLAAFGCLGFVVGFEFLWRIHGCIAVVS